MNLSRCISQVCALYFLPFLFHQFAFALRYLKFWFLHLFSTVESILSQSNPLNNPKTKQDFFTNVPSEIIIDILSRLPVRTILCCKCVCKSWFHLVETPEFAESHLPKSVPGLAIFQPSESMACKIFEFEEDLCLRRHHLHCNLVTKFDLHYAMLHGSANGLLFLRDVYTRPKALYICNPLTREFVQLQVVSPDFVYPHLRLVDFGFGVSKITGQYKLVGIFQDCIFQEETRDLLRIFESEYHVYTLGTGSWRRIASGGHLKYRNFGVFLNGNLHWLVFDLNECSWISCFDLETELFSTFSSPPLESYGGHTSTLIALGDCLCLCDNTDDKIIIWLIKEYGDEKSWTKEIVIELPDLARQSINAIYPIKVFKNGDILMAWHDFSLFYYNNRDKTTQRTDMFGPFSCISIILHTPTFLSLKSFNGFESENVNSF